MQSQLSLPRLLFAAVSTLAIACIPRQCISDRCDRCYYPDDPDRGGDPFCRERCIEILPEIPKRTAEGSYRANVAVYRAKVGEQGVACCGSDFRHAQCSLSWKRARDPETIYRESVWSGLAIFDNQTNRNDICTIYPSRLGIPQHFLERADENEAFVVAAFYHVDEMPMPVIACKVLTPPPGEPPMDDIIHLPSHIYDDGDLEHPFYRAESCPDAGLGPPLGTLLDADGGQIDGGN